jgi:hypothetical protein
MKQTWAFISLFKRRLAGLKNEESLKRLTGL